MVPSNSLYSPSSFGFGSEMLFHTGVVEDRGTLKQGRQAQAKADKRRALSK